MDRWLPLFTWYVSLAGLRHFLHCTVPVLDSVLDSVLSILKDDCVWVQIKEQHEANPTSRQGLLQPKDVRVSGRDISSFRSGTLGKHRLPASTSSTFACMFHSMNGESGQSLPVPYLSHPVLDPVAVSCQQGLTSYLDRNITGCCRSTYVGSKEEPAQYG